MPRRCPQLALRLFLCNRSPFGPAFYVHWLPARTRDLAHAGLEPPSRPVRTVPRGSFSLRHVASSRGAQWPPGVLRGKIAVGELAIPVLV